jgi:hypothetical protein
MVLAAYRAGRSFADLHKAVMAGEFLPAKAPDLSLPTVG